MNNPEEILKELPRFQTDNFFKNNLKEKLLKENAVIPQKTSFLPRLALAFILILLLSGAFFFNRWSNRNPLKPSLVMAAEIIKENLNRFIKPNTIYHQKTVLYSDGGNEPIVYEIWEDQDTDRFLNHVIYPDRESWQSFDLETRWNIETKEKTVQKEIYQYQDPEEKLEKKGQRVDLAEKFDHLVKEGTLTVKEGKLDTQEVYVIYDTRNSLDKFWDTLTFDKNTFALLRTEKYQGEGNERKLVSLVIYETQEALPRTEENLKMFIQPPISLDGYDLYERHFDTAKGYLDDYQKISTPSSSLNEERITLVETNSECNIIVTTNLKTLVIKTEKAKLGLKCNQEKIGLPSKEGNLLVFDDLSKGNSYSLKLFSLNEEETLSLGVLGKVDIKDKLFLPSGKLAILGKDNFNVQSLIVYDLPKILRDFPFSTDTNQNLIHPELYEQKINLPNIEEDYLSLSIFGNDLQILGKDNKILESYNNF
ncbi:MAG: hypothetical protein M1514_00200 [Patescibacteria group bacterium]|nr:hypothetical protein [Patescibacteria group bacterium]